MQQQKKVEIETMFGTMMIKNEWTKQGEKYTETKRNMLHRNNFGATITS